MATQLIHDQGRGPEINGTRITIYTLLPHFLDPDTSEASICERYDLTPEQVAAARAYVLNQPDVVLGGYLQIEAKLVPGNPPEVVEKAEKTRAALLSFKEWLARRESTEAADRVTEGEAEEAPPHSRRLPTFKEWLAERESRSGGKS
jgi:uncharacterized protein (DUF433 family)